MLTVLTVASVWSAASVLTAIILAGTIRLRERHKR